MRKAVIDLGTNTFHLLIVDVESKDRISPILRLRKYIFLGEGGIDHISPAAFKRGLKALKEFKYLLEENQVDVVKAVGTSALRNAKNSTDFVDSAAQLGIDVEVIDGESEAKFIARGVQMISGQTAGHDLIMDIGGGSVEFSLLSAGAMMWSLSFKVGLSILKAMHDNDPISADEIESINFFLEDKIGALFASLENTTIDRLIGASGTFEVLNFINPHSSPGNSHSLFHIIDRLELEGFINQVVQMSLSDRVSHARIPKQRARFMPVAMLLVQFILSRVNIKGVYYSEYAMKEGIAIS